MKLLFISLLFSFASMASQKFVEKGMGRIQGILKEEERDAQRSIGRAAQPKVLSKTSIKVYSGTFSPMKTQEGEDIPATIDLVNREPLRSLYTDEAGRFTVDLPPGTYTLFYLKEGRLLHADGDWPQDETKQAWRSITVKANFAIDYNEIMKKRKVLDFGLIIVSEIK